MEMKLGMVTLEPLGQRPTRRNRPHRKPEPTQREENPLQGPPSNRTAIYVRNLPSDQDPEQKLQADLALCRDYCKEQGLEVVIEYSDPKGSWKAFDQMMAVATGNKPPFDNIVVPSFRNSFARDTIQNIECRQQLRQNGVTVKSLTPGV